MKVEDIEKKFIRDKLRNQACANFGFSCDIGDICSISIRNYSKENDEFEKLEYVRRTGFNVFLSGKETITITDEKEINRLLNRVTKKNSALVM
jgi:hypothetical protein